MKHKKFNITGVTQALSLVMQLGLTLAVCIFIGVFLGKFIDDKAGTSPLFLIVFTLFGIGAAIKTLYDITMHHFKQK